MRKRLLTALLSFAMLLSLAPAALAAESGLIQLDAPESLTWSSGSTEEGQWDNFGLMRWTANASGTQNQFQLYCFKDGETEPVFEERSSWGNYGSSDFELSYHSSAFITNSDALTSGTYYFTVTALGDGTQYSDSPTAISEKWEYTKPSERIAVVEELSWEWPNAKWTKPSSADSIGGYDIMFYFSETKDGSPRGIGGVIDYNNGADYTQQKIIDTYIQENGDGYYYFKVCALSADITRYLNSEWSELSPAYVSGEVTETVKDSLEGILNSGESDASAIKEAVQDLITEDLRTSMLADQGDNDTVDLIRQLEEKAGGPAGVQAAEGFDKLDTTQVSITGANLNTSADNSATLNIGPAKNEHDVLPTQVDNTLAVSFSMELEGVDDTENLAVPVKITLPVPASINPQFLVILHYHLSTGEPELIWPHVYQTGGQYYASFVLTSFSDFIMSEIIQSSGPSGDPSDSEEAPGGQVTPPVTDLPVYFPPSSGSGSTGGTAGAAAAKPQQTVEPETPEETPQPETPSVPEQPSVPVPAFRDVAPTAWYSAAVTYASAQGLMTGTTDTEFSPNANMTRAMVWTVLGRLDGADVAGAGAAWYERAQAWSITKGVSDGTNPNGSITREELVTMLWRYIGSPIAPAELTQFTDSAAVSGWASGAIQWAVSAGLLEGSGGALNPSGTATRAEVAAILMRFCENVKK